MKRIVQGMAVGALLALFAACPGARSGDVEFILANGAEPSSLDPAVTTGVPERRVHMALYGGLTTLDVAGITVPDIAESWDISDDGLTVYFFIRQGMSFSDGHPLTAVEVWESLISLLNPETTWAYGSTGIMQWQDGEAALNGTMPYRDARAWEVVDSHTIRHNRISPVVVADWSDTSHMIRPMHVVREHGVQWTQPANHVSSGPFVLDQWMPQDRLVMSPNPNYWNRENVFIDTLQILTIPDSMASFNAFRNGEVDWSTGLPPGMIDVIRLMPEWQVGPSMATYNYAFNLTHPHFQDVRVRRALALTLDRENLVTMPFLSTGQIPVRGFVPLALNGAPYNYQHFPNDNAAGDMWNPDLARQLLAEAGYPNGVGFPTLTILYNTLDGHRMIAEFIAHTWQTELGINLELVNMEWQSFLASRRNPETQMFLMSWQASVNNPMGHMQIFMTGDDNNQMQYSDPEVDALLREALTLPAGWRRSELMRAAEEIVIGRDQAVIPVYNFTTSNMIDLTKWQGWQVNPAHYHTFVGIRPL